MALAIQPFDDRMEIGCHSIQIEGVWEISVFGSNGAVSERQRTRRKRPLPFVANLPAVMKLFDQVEECRWQALAYSKDDELGPHVSLRGDYEGRKVWLRILSRPPKRVTGEVQP